jgi:hypothetical protein
MVLRCHRSVTDATLTAPGRRSRTVTMLTLGELVVVNLGAEAIAVLVVGAGEQYR